MGAAKNAVRRGRSASKRSLDVVLDKIESGEAVVFATFTVASAPAAASNAGRIIHLSNGAAGSPCLARSDGTNWKQIAIGGNIAAS